jgi:hypothetical protein
MVSVQALPELDEVYTPVMKRGHAENPVLLAGCHTRFGVR